MFPTNREIWNRIDGYSNYEVSNFGRVCNATTERILKHRTRKDRYLDVGLSKNGSSKRLLVHRLVVEAFFENPAEKRCVDHIDGNRANNHWENLRYATHAENSRNMKKHTDGSSVYKGVCYHKLSRKWKTQIMVDGKVKYLGLYNDEREAAEVYNKAALEHYKEFAKLNVFED